MAAHVSSARSGINQCVVAFFRSHGNQFHRFSVGEFLVLRNFIGLFNCYFGGQGFCFSPCEADKNFFLGGKLGDFIGTGGFVSFDNYGLIVPTLTCRVLKSGETVPRVPRIASGCPV